MPPSAARWRRPWHESDLLPFSAASCLPGACGIVYALGQINFLFDKSNIPHVPHAEVCAAFGLKTSTGSNKAKEIRDILKINGPMDPDWTLPSQLERNPMAWMVTVNGLVIDARQLPRPLQEEAFRQGLIPYVPESPPNPR